MSDRVIFPPQALCGQPGWSDGELAAIRAATEPLAHSGRAIDIGWGMSDEGDPWFAVTDAASGDPILHLTRLNNSFTAVGPGLGGALHARDLHTLITESARRLLQNTNPSASS